MWAVDEQLANTNIMTTAAPSHFRFFFIAIRFIVKQVCCLSINGKKDAGITNKM
jgi:hypothetical protein